MATIRAPKEDKNKITGNDRDSITRAKAIRLQCVECTGFQLKLINTCTDEACPLWGFRKGKGFEHTDVPLRVTKKDLKIEI